MATYKQQYLDTLAEAKSLANKPDATEKDLDTAREKLEEAKEYRQKAEAADAGDALRKEISDALVDLKAERQDLNSNQAATLGEHFIKSAGDRLELQAKRNQMQISVPEFKAASDPQTSPAAGTVPVYAYGTQLDRAIVNQKREELVVADIMGSVSISGGSITYLVEKLNRIAEGGPGAVAEAGKKPYIRYDSLDIVTEALKKIAVLNKQSEEMLSDFDFMKSYIDNMLTYDLSLKEENDLLNGDGIGANINGLTKRSGLQSFDIEVDKELDGIAEAMAKIPRAAGLRADALVMNDEDFLAIKLKKDSNGQYFAGGPFQNQYGAGGLVMNPAPWGLKTVTTNAMEQGTYILGAFKQGAIVVRKGGVRVDSTNTNADDFENNLITLRAEERAGLMVPRPAAFITGTFAASA